MRPYIRILLIVLLMAISSTAFGATANGQGDPQKPNFQDGSWLRGQKTNYEVPLVISHTEKWVFTVGTQQAYIQIGTGVQAYELMPIDDPSTPILTSWTEEGVTYYALLSAGKLYVGTRFHIHTEAKDGRWISSFVSVGKSGPIIKWEATIEIKNPEFSLPSTPTPPSPTAPLLTPSIKQRRST